MAEIFKGEGTKVWLGEKTELVYYIGLVNIVRHGLWVAISDWPIYNDSKTSRGRYEMPRTNYMARLADSYLRSTLSFNGLDSVLIRFCFIQSLLNISVPQMGTNGALALAPAAPSTPPTSPVTVKKIRIIIFYHRRSS